MALDHDKAYENDLDITETESGQYEVHNLRNGETYVADVTDDGEILSIQNMLGGTPPKGVQHAVEETLDQ